MKGALHVILGLLMVPVLAQAQVYKWVGPDGKLNYSDSPPPAGAKSVQTPRLDSDSSDVALPWALQQAVKDNPVTLYTTRDCQPCDEARQWLARRGVPLSERTVNSREDLDQFKTLAGANQLPALRVGNTVKRGFDIDGWQQALNAAAYPEPSRLPANWRNPAPSPLAPAKPAAPRAAGAPAAERTAPNEAAAAPGNAPSNVPPGFRF